MVQAMMGIGVDSQPNAVFGLLSRHLRQFPLGDVFRNSTRR